MIYENSTLATALTKQLQAHSTGGDETACSHRLEQLLPILEHSRGSMQTLTTKMLVRMLTQDPYVVLQAAFIMGMHVALEAVSDTTVTNETTIH